ncbi:hypothetical protein DOM21_17660 [Bacteriovorax stolpii]|uniref:class I SAM-dependent methyltransferase n=1 Tax=Bacteriovorax stolpii TaxID=960 RepID=UPI001159F078|nr:class I SAM-dependent methyltransferase [Bacteriovorax stolpii]QDK43250.1 hypothetical protein DOM21_17660 [Bacteriovorax stolpii]
MTDYRIVQENEAGYRVIQPKPSIEELAFYYKDAYHQVGTYAPTYSETEKLYRFLPACEIEAMVPNGKSIIDIGCGEGFILEHFFNKGWEVAGLDFSLKGIMNHFPHLAKNVVEGDIFVEFEKIIKTGKKFDVINCSNVIEHLIDPVELLNLIKQISHPGTMIRLQLPNDFSWMQSVLEKHKLINSQYWIAIPDHLSYFNYENLKVFLQENQFTIHEQLGDFPIEMFLLNSSSNYNVNKSTGKGAHEARMLFETEMYKRSPADFLKSRKAYGNLEIGRNIILYFRSNG